VGRIVGAGAGPPVVALVGPSGSGKTTLLERLVVEFSRSGLRVGAVKHARHGFDFDRPGKDTWRFKAAGAAAVAAISPGALGLLRMGGGEMALAEAVGLLGDVDLVLVEGFGDQAARCVEVRGGGERGAGGRMPPGGRLLLAVAAARPGAEPAPAGVPVFDRNDVPGIAGLILAAVGVRAGGGAAAGA
jgi:molybdopterin-guanine dinucleotide biosynthesis protein B